MLRCQPVIDTKHGQIQLSRDLSAYRRMRIEVAEDEATPVKIDNQGSGMALAARIEQPGRYRRSGRPRHGDILDHDQITDG